MIACGGGKVIKTTEGGSSWQEYQAGDTRALYTINIVDTLHIAAAGGPLGKNVYSNDGGLTWVQNGDLPYSAGANWIQFIDGDTGYITGAGPDLMKTTNKGLNWTAVGLNFDEGDWQFELLVNLSGFGVGSGLTLTKTENSYENWFRLIMNDDFSDVYFTNELTGYIAGGSYIGGPVYKSSDGGINWIGLPNFPSSAFTTSLRSLTFTDNITGFAGGSPSRIVKTTDAGNSWYIANRTGLTDTTGSINKILFINPNIGWAVTTRGGILKTTDGGENWFAQLNAGILRIFRSIYFIDSLNGWTANGNARPYKTTDGGEIWIEQSNLNIWDSRDIYFKDSLNGFIVESNVLYQSTDGGMTWILNPDVTGFSVAARFSYYGSNFIYITGYTTYRTTNGGEDWIEFNELNGIRINGLNLLNEGLGFAVGELGIILQYIDSTYIPVELITFQGKTNSNKVILRWQTASELNNKGFEIERSESEKRNWGNIGFVKGNGTTTEEHSYSFSDIIEEPGDYCYRLKQIDFDGKYEYSDVVEVRANFPLRYNLSQNFPNPFNSSTRISYQIPNDEFVTLKVYDVLGNEVTTLVDENKNAGYYAITFSPNDLGSGIYFYKLAAGGYKAIKKLILLR